MRQGQQHRRGRGRNNNNHNHNRRGQNPLSRSFESNGPDVKVRGTPAHIAEKYLSLARDAQSSGDPVLAENYFQHAEHYNRIIMAYREQQMQQAGEQMNGSGPRMEHEDGGGDDDGDEFGHGDQPPAQSFPGGDQPRFQNHYRGDDNRQHRHHDQGRFRDRNDRNDRGDRHERHQDRQDRFYDRQSQPDARHSRDRGGDRERFSGGDGQQSPQQSPPSTPTEAAPQQQPRADQQPQRRRERFGPGNEQPDFLRRPVRRPRRDNGNGEASEEHGASEANGREDGPQDKSTA
jgi:hypothetical protein